MIRLFTQRNLIADRADFFIGDYKGRNPNGEQCYVRVSKSYRWNNEVPSVQEGALVLDVFHSLNDRILVSVKQDNFVSEYQNFKQTMSFSDDRGSDGKLLTAISLQFAGTELSRAIGKQISTVWGPEPIETHNDCAGLQRFDINELFH